MKLSESELSRHLARRDGELEVVSDDPPDDALSSTLVALKAELNEVGDVPLGERDWLAQIDEHRSPRRRLLAYPVATAASVLVVSALFVAGIGIEWRDGPAADGDLASIDLGHADLVSVDPNSLPSLIARSQDLENLAQTSGGWSGAEAQEGRVDTALTRLILMQVAAIDDRLTSLDGSLDTDRTRMLWQRRVNLLQAYNAAIENVDPDVTNSRSM